MSSKISGVITAHENDFFLAFKNKMYAIMKEMKELRDRAATERHKAKQEARLINLERERDWFRREALKLDRMCKDQKKILARLKTTLESIEEDKEFYQEQLIQTKRANKALVLENETLKSKNREIDRRIGASPLAILGPPEIGDTRRRYLEGHALKDLKFDLDQVMKEVDALENPDAGEIMDRYWEDNQGENHLSGPGTIDFKEEHQDKVILRMEDHKLLIKRLENLSLEVSDLKFKVDDRDSQIYDLRGKLELERKNAKWTKTDKVKRVMERNDLEEFFVECVEEVRKDVVRRRTASAGYGVKKNMRKSTSSKTIENPREDEHEPRLD